MKTLRLHGKRDIRLHDEDEPTPTTGESLIRVSAVGICGSDLHWFSEAGIGDAQLDHPLVLGHEFAALTLDGQRIAVDPCVSCGSCRECQEGNPNLCPNHYFAGHGHVDGALRQMMAWPTKTFYPLPDALSDIEGAMLEPLGVAIHSSDLGHVKPGYRIAILGCGPIGILLVQLARLVGATQIIATDKLPHRVDAAHEFGATQAYTVGGRERDAELWSITEGEGFDVVFEVAGENDAVETALEIARPGGQIVLAGIPADDQITFSASIARRKGLTFRAVRRMKHTYSRAIRLVESGKVDVRSVVTHCYSLKEFQTAFDVASRRDGLKVIIQP